MQIIFVLLFTEFINNKNNEDFMSTTNRENTNPPAYNQSQQVFILVDKPIRSAIKAISYRISGSLATMAISFVFIGSVKIAVSIGIVEVISKMGLYYLHERLWSKLPFGRVKAPEYQI
jgi:uncharacterized membrane protein